MPRMTPEQKNSEEKFKNLIQLGIWVISASVGCIAGWNIVRDANPLPQADQLEYQKVLESMPQACQSDIKQTYNSEPVSHSDSLLSALEANKQDCDTVSQQIASDALNDARIVDSDVRYQNTKSVLGAEAGVIVVYAGLSLVCGRWYRRYVNPGTAKLPVATH